MSHPIGTEVLFETKQQRATIKCLKQPNGKTFFVFRAESAEFDLHTDLSYEQVLNMHQVLASFVAIHDSRHSDNMDH